MAKKKAGATKKKIPSGEIHQQWLCPTCKIITKQPIVRTTTEKRGKRLIHHRECEGCKAKLLTIEVAETDILEIKSKLQRLTKDIAEIASASANAFESISELPR